MDPAAGLRVPLPVRPPPPHGPRPPASLRPLLGSPGIYATPRPAAGSLVLTRRGAKEHGYKNWWIRCIPGVAASAEQAEATPEDMENIREIKRVLELLKKNRDMTFGEVKLTIMIEDPRDIERKRTLGIEDLADALAEVNKGQIPENRVALQLLAKEMAEWPDLEIEAPKKKSKLGKSVYAKATDTGIDPEAAAKRLNLDWDSAADIDGDEEDDDETEVPPAVGYGALYLLTAFPVIIGISVVLILFYNSLQ
ncbi:hypothetical protein U9M48_044582 [Paspalum notatum var. saurae]|uniref:Protein CHLOROPLAST ENHANCING STRESS TOLERANCE, chloroplastic n=1 Tax=Paspalum notatum var. saurae TaxID=547442 RepID=A0AAQ3UVD3_PASNO